ncbi:collagen alpha-3(VI) chain-like [Rhinoraja longicauda]
MEMEYARMFAVAFLKSLETGINNYPPKALRKECNKKYPQHTEEKETFPNAPMNIMEDVEEQKDGINVYAACGLNKDPGNCDNHSLKWYFNKTLRICRMFWYSGCKGNENRFDTRVECEALCLKSSY